jgi:hydrogenase expression/formation protein HypD
VVFLGIGFETTSPTVAAAFLRAAEQGMRNLLLLAAFKTIPAALAALLASPQRSLDGLLLPGHVSAVIGVEAYRFLEGAGGVPAVIAGFEPLDLLAAILGVLRQVAAGERRVENGYTRAVRPGGNPVARRVLGRLLEPVDALWRGLGWIAESGLGLLPQYAWMDAARCFDLPPLADREPAGCRCAQVIQGRLLPPECPLFGRGCSPERPAGPCMVSSEGTCAAHYRYGEVDDV